MASALRPTRVSSHSPILFRSVLGFPLFSGCRSRRHLRSQHAQGCAAAPPRDEDAASVVPPCGWRYSHCSSMGQGTMQKLPPFLGAVGDDADSVAFLHAIRDANVSLRSTTRTSVLDDNIPSFFRTKRCWNILPFAFPM